MGMLWGFGPAGPEAGFALPVRRTLVTLAGAFFLAGMGPAGAADIEDVEPSSYTYIAIEGGYIHLDGEKAQAFFYYTEPDTESSSHERSLDLSDGFYGRAELGRVWDTGAINGIGAYVQGWEGDGKDISQTEFGMLISSKSDDILNSHTHICSDTDERPCARGDSDLDRSLLEVGFTLVHAYGDAPDQDSFSLGIEPFVAFIEEDASTTIGNTFEGPFQHNAHRSSDLDATAYGALIALDGRHHVLEGTVLTGRVAAGAYYMDADADTSFDHLPPFPGSSSNNDLSSDFFGFRGQLAVGLEQMLTDMFSIGVIGRLDYWSDFPSMRWTDYAGGPPVDPSDDLIAEEDFLALSIGARLSVTFR